MPVGEAAERAAALRSMGPHRRILVAEDNRINQLVISKMLERAGHDVTLVGNGEEALDLLAEGGRFDLVIMDLNMPVMGGLDAVRLHRFATGGRDGPAFIALTADATEETRRQCETAGFEGYLAKPVDVVELLTLVDRLTGMLSAAPPVPLGQADARWPAHGAQAVPPALDPVLLERLRQLDEQDGFVRQIIDDFILDAEQLIGELGAAAVAVDVATFRDRAHALRSSAAHIGARALFELCLGWRGIGAAELAAQGTGHTARLEIEFERLRAALRAELAEPAGLEPRAVIRPH